MEGAVAVRAEEPAASAPAASWGWRRTRCKYWLEAEKFLKLCEAAVA